MRRVDDPTSRRGDTQADEASRAHGPQAHARTAALRFAVFYWALNILPFPVGSVPGTEWAAQGYYAGQAVVIRFMGVHVLGVTRPIPFEPTGSGDTTASWIWLFCMAAFALVGLAGWTAVDRRPAEHERLRAGLRVTLRYVLASTMLAYGFVKVFKSQFPFPAPSALLTSYGESSPMGLLWRFMGYSTTYTVFAGLCEVLGGTLLFFKRTTMLGAMILVGVMGNVVLLNFSYDVPVKINSSHLLAMAVLLLLPDAKRLLSFLVLNRAVPAAVIPPASGSPRRRLLLAVSKLVVVGGAFTLSIVQGWESYNSWGDGKPRDPLHGIYAIEAADDKGAPVASLSKWGRATLDRNGFVLFGADGKRHPWKMEYDADSETLQLSDEAGLAVSTAPGAATRDAELLELAGQSGGAPITIRLRRVSERELLLVDRGFHWINERPYHR